MAQPLVNGNEYTYADIVVAVLGAPLVGAKAISYEETQEKTNNYAQGNRPVSRGAGAIETTASIDLLMTDVEQLRNVAPDGSLLKIPSFDITVTYLTDQKVVTHVLKNAEFISDTAGGSQGDTELVGTYNLVSSHVKYR